MKGWSKTRLCGHEATIAALAALLLLAVTIATASASPLTISSVEVGNITHTSATITWITDVVATSVVNYGTTTPPTSQVENLTLVTSHSVTLSGLNPGTTYYYDVRSTDEAGNTTSDNNGGLYYTFTTTVPPDTPTPMITGVQAIAITATSANIVWTTDEPATSVVNYGNTTALDLTVSDATLVTSHSVPLSALDPMTTYYYEVQSTNERGNTATDDNEGTYRTFTIYRLTGWSWCTDQTEIANAELVVNVTLVPRADTPEVSDLHLAGNLILTLSDATTETIDVSIYGSKIRSLFYLRQEVEGKSVSFKGIWLTWDDGQYLSTLGRITFPEGEVFKTAKVYLLQLRTPGGEIPDREPDGFVNDLEYTITMFAKFIDGLIDKLMLTDFVDILGSVLAKIMVLVAGARELGVPYIP